MQGTKESRAKAAAARRARRAVTLEFAAYQKRVRTTFGQKPRDVDESPLDLRLANLSPVTRRFFAEAGLGIAACSTCQKPRLLPVGVQVCRSCAAERKVA
jgi:hypothetical protein